MKKILIVSCLYLLALQARSQINKQELSMWCWAACIQSALGQANVMQSQAQIVARLAGWPQDRPANGSEIVAVLKSYAFKAWLVPYPANYADLYKTLSTGWKLIAWVNPTNNPQVGHFIMLQGISPSGFIVISDPATGFTYQQSVEQLYYAWKWGNSVVVGTP